jgi:lantibiotic modifying enzyme
MAVGEHPVLLDLEALFHPANGGVDLSQADQVADNVLYDSVLGVGLLPQRVWSNDKSAGIDLSGLGGAAGQLMPHGIPQWEDEGTDEMRLVRKRLAMRTSHNRPTLQGAEVNPFDYDADIVTGFEQIYYLLLKHREELLSTGGPLVRFAQDEVRVILRDTRTYAILLRESFHPDLLRNAVSERSHLCKVRRDFFRVVVVILRNRHSMVYECRWNEWNEDHIAHHGVEPGEA